MSIEAFISKKGPKISLSELKKIEKKYGQEGISQLQKTSGISLKSKAQDWLNAYTQPAAAAAPEAPAPPVQNPQEVYTQGSSVGKYNIPAGRYSEGEFAIMGQGILEQLRGDVEREKQQIAGLTAQKVAEIEAGATKYGYDRDVEAKKYLADQDLLKGTRIAEIEGQKRIDLQDIINAGLKEVEGIRGQTERDVANIAGEFGVKQESERQRGAKEIAQIGSQSGFRNALIGAFSF